MKKLACTLLCFVTYAGLSLYAAAPSSPSLVRAVGRDIRIRERLPDGTLAAEDTYTILGVCYEPTLCGDQQSDAIQRYYDERERDLPLIKAMGANTIRLYAIPAYHNETGLAFLDACYENGIKVIVTVHSKYKIFEYKRAVPFFKDHPAILAWSVGNEFDINRLYTSPLQTIENCIVDVTNVVAQIKALDANHPVIVCWGDPFNNGFSTYYSWMTNVDIFSFNIYSGNTFSTRFTVWGNLTADAPKPMFISEYGADAYNTTLQDEDQSAQALTANLLTTEIINNLVLRNLTNVCSGGTIFEFNDEWWKYQGSGASVDVHNTQSSKTGTIHPDNRFNEEWFGVVDIHRIPRQAYYALQTNFTNYLETRDTIRTTISPSILVPGEICTIRIEADSAISSPQIRVTDKGALTNALSFVQLAPNIYEAIYRVPSVENDVYLFFEGSGIVESKPYIRFISALLDVEGPTAPERFRAQFKEDHIAVTWNASADASSGVRGYVVHRVGEPEAAVETTSLSFRDEIRIGDGVVDYTIVAIDTVGNKSEAVTTRAVRMENAALSGRIIRDTALSVYAYLYQDEKYRIQVFDARGNRIMRDELVAVKDGRYELLWDGCDAKGKKAPKGLYYVKINVGGEKTQTEKVFMQ